MLSNDITRRIDELAAQFRDAKPFRHVVMDGFFEPAFAEALLAEFPPFERGDAMSENGTLGNKSTVEKIRELGSRFEALDEAIQGRAFLDVIGRITGIDDLLYDPWYFGGGTHENRHGQDLDPHIDFNRHPVEPWHRRLNLIVYLNREWEDDWGGSLELHSDPRSDQDQVTLVTPLFNRAVIFETTETSWHGFRRIDLPEDRRDVSRKSIALYFYSVDRPAAELADTHSTVYVDRPLPERFRPGLTLQESDVEELRVLLARRDQHNQRLYRDISRQQVQLEQLQAAIAGGRLGRLRYYLSRLRARF